MISHELRTLLNAILGYCDLLLEEAFGSLSEEQAHSLRRIRSNARTLLELMTAVLDVNRLEAGQPPVALTEVEVSKVLQELQVEAQEAYERSGLDFRWEVEGKPVPIRTDPEKLKVVLRHLLDNAVKFTAQGSITVRAVAKRGGLEVRVSDTGTGIPQEALGFIFEPFHQLGPATTSSFRGTGLGLYIVKQVLDLLGGTFTIDSEV